MSCAMQASQKVALFLEKFGGIRSDVFALRAKNERDYFPVRKPLRREQVVSHWRGRLMLSAYPMDRENNTAWVAADFDDKSGEHREQLVQTAYNLAETLREAEIEPLCNISKSGNGIHVRVIFERPIQAWQARLLMAEAMAQAGAESTDAVPIEIFPKQDYLDDDQNAVGSPLTMPLNGRQIQETGGTRLLFLHKSSFLPIDLGDQTWAYLLQHQSTSVEALLDAALSWDAYHRVISPERFKESSYDYTDDEYIPRINLEEQDLQLIVESCLFFERAMSKPLSYPEWLALASILVQYRGIGGRRAFQHISSLDNTKLKGGKPRYDRQRADKQFDAVIDYRPRKCQKLVKDGFACPAMGMDGQCDMFRSVATERGPLSPAAIPYFKNNYKE